MLVVVRVKFIPYCQIPPFSEIKKSLLGISFEQESGSNPVKTDFTLSINSYKPH